MHDPTFIHDPKLRQLVQDLDTFADVLHPSIDRDRLTSRHGESVPGGDAEFTTEWQMASTVEEPSVL